MFNATDPYSYYEVDQLGIKVSDDDESYTRDDCVGKIDIERETKTVTKSCRGVVKKRKTRVTGGKLTISAHVKLELYRRLHAMTNDGLQPGVYAYDTTASMPEFSLVARVKNEDDDIMYLGYPRCMIEEISTLTIENGAEEVAEIEMTISFMADDNDKPEYQALADELTGEVLTKDNWMTDFSSEKAKLATS